MQQVLVAGATGHLGPHLCKALMEAGKNVYALIRPETINNEEKVGPLKALGVQLVAGDLNDAASLHQACEGMDAIVSALGGGQIMQQKELLEAAKAKGIQRFIPSEFGIDPHLAGPGSCDLFDAKAAFQKELTNSGVPYTMIYTNGFMEWWASGFGQLGNSPASGAVELYGDGSNKVALVSLPDIGKFTAEILDDPDMANQEVAIIANVSSQEDLIATWEKISGQQLERKPVSAEQLDHIIDQSTTPETFMQRIVTQLHRSVWIRGEGTAARDGVLEATQKYPNLTLMKPEEFFSTIAGTTVGNG